MKKKTVQDTEYLFGLLILNNFIVIIVFNLLK